MANYLTTKGDKTSKSTVPDFNTEKAHHWMHMVSGARAAGTEKKFPHKPRKGLAEQSFFGAVDIRLSRKSFSMGISFDKEGKIIHG
jgi:hypothetical protein